jgi:ABC-type transport system involved in cytochrome c biogenesis permease subunit
MTAAFGSLYAGPLWGGLACYVAAGVIDFHSRSRQRESTRAVLALLAAGVLCFAGLIAERWLRLGYGPFLTLFEVIVSNLFSIGLVFTLVYWRHKQARSATPVALSILLLLGIWALASSDHGSRLPATYYNPWLWLHVGSGKLFLAICVVATGLAGHLLMRGRLVSRPLEEGGTSAADLDRSAWQFLALAFIFHSLMLITGAIWAQDAWGRYWAWDPLETWAFATWLTMALLLHARVTFKVPPSVGWWMIVLVFVLAFLTFFGVPFLSYAPHKGAV